MQIKNCVFVLLMLFSSACLAQVERLQLTSDIAAREPVDDLGNQVTGSADQATRVVLFTHVRNLRDQQIIHRWFYRDEEMAAVPLNIGSDNWRTYSSKKILPGWRGQWRVEVWHGDLQLTQHQFTFETYD